MGGIFGGGGILQEGSSTVQFLVLIALVWERLELSMVWNSLNLMEKCYLSSLGKPQMLRELAEKER